jgi:membrane-associated phospholipid phosphatase
MDKHITNAAQSRGGAARIAIIYASLIALIVFSYFFLDRQLATALRPYTHDAPIFKWLTYVVNPIAPLASIAAVFVAARSVARGSLTPIESAILRLCCAVLIAYVLKEELKYVFGRTWPETWIHNNPSFFGNGTYGFFLLHGGADYASFPSGHTTAVSAVAGSLWRLWTPLRWLGIALVAAVVIGLLGADYHWLSDILAGGTLGATTGLVAARIGRSNSAA